MLTELVVHFLQISNVDLHQRIGVGWAIALLALMTSTETLPSGAGSLLRRWMMSPGVRVHDWPPPVTSRAVATTKIFWVRAGGRT